MESEALRVCKAFLGTAGFKKCHLKSAISLLSEKSPPKHKVSENRNRTLSSQKWRVICNPESKQARKGVKGQAASFGEEEERMAGLGTFSAKTKKAAFLTVKDTPRVAKPRSPFGKNGRTSRFTIP